MPNFRRRNSTSDRESDDRAKKGSSYVEPNVQNQYGMR
ncbi:hypothetical protein PoMZ_02505 [Pyricularia oryzae]|uniref:Uncharacterized protein n=1 Tax=Pyricularia oryzae TaxID=318829 RepID=A0A4P7N996_PYROR|nr:hypothetical protein PoMZ_02505 [Pyricularia oryzae]